MKLHPQGSYKYRLFLRVSAVENKLVYIPVIYGSYISILQSCQASIKMNP